MIKHYPKKLLVAALLLTGGGIGAYADTTVLTEANGWHKITSISQADIASNYYVFVDNASDLTLHLANSSAQGNQSLFYQKTVDPASDLSEVFILEANGSNYLMRPLTKNDYAMQTEWSQTNNDLRWRTNDQAGVISWTGLGLSYSNGAWSLTSKQYNRPLGIYNNGTGDPKDGSEVGANDAANGQKFQIYAIKKGDLVPTAFSNATEDNPVQTYYVINGSFAAPNSQANPPYPWGYTTDASNHGISTNPQGTGFEGRSFENYRGSALSAGNLYQKITDIPNGKYRLNIAAMVNNVGAAGTQYVYANNDKTNITAQYGTYTVETNVTDNTVEIGLGLASGNTANWVALDNAVLYYLGAISDYSAYVTSLADEVSKGKAVDTTKPMNASVKKTLEDAITEYSSKTESSAYATAEAWEAAIKAMQTATANANTSIANYATAKSYLDAASSLDDAGKASYASDETVKAVQTAYDAATLEAVTAEQVTAMNTALQTAAKAQTTAGADMTLAIVNPSFEINDGQLKEITENHGWSQDGSLKFVAQTNDAFGKKDGGSYAENYQPNGNLNIFQTITGLKSGVYRLTASALARSVTSASIYAGDNSTDVQIADAANDYIVEFATDGGDITIGAKAVGTGVGQSWVALDNFKLTLVSSSLPDVTAETGKMNSDVESAQTKAIETYNSNKTVANYNAAVKAIAAAQASVDAYTNAKKAIDERKALVKETNFYTADAYAEYITTPETAYENGSLTDNDAKNLEAPSNVANSTGSTYDGKYWRVAAQMNKFFGAAWGVTAYADNELYVNTWSVEGNTDKSNFRVPFYEYFTGNANTLAAKTLTGTLIGLTPGWYKVSLDAREQLVNAQNTTVKGISMNVNDGESVELNKGVKTADNNNLFYANYTAYGQVGEDGVLKLNIDVADGNNVHWLSFQHVKYAKVEEVTLDQEETAAPAKSTDAVIATLNRTFLAGWNSIVLPFATTTEALGAAEAAEYQGTENSTIYFKKTTELKANTPYLVYFDADKSNVTFNGVTIDPSTDITVEDTKGNQFDLVGTYVALAQDNETVKAGDYIVVTKGIQKAAGGNVIKAFRAYLQAKSAAAAAKNMTINIDGDTVTGIDAMQIHEALSDDNVYNLAGQRVGKDYKGIVIKNGKKVIEK